MKKINLIYLLALTTVACKSSKETTTNSSNKTLNSIDVSYISDSIKAKDDFFMFSNEKWLVNNPVPASESRWGSFNELDKSNKEKINAIFNELNKSTHKVGSDEQILCDYYNSYLNLEKRASIGEAFLKKDIDKIDALKSRSELPSFIADLHSRGIGSLFSFGVGQDLNNVEHNISYLSDEGLSLPNRDYYFQENKKEIREKFYVFQVDLLKLYGYNDVDAKTIAKESYMIEQQIAEKMFTPAEMRIPEKTYNKMSLEETTKMFAPFDFEGYLKAINSLAFDSLVLSNVDNLNVTAKILNELPLDQLKSYFKWHTLNFYAGKLGQKYVDMNFSFYGKTLSGKKEMKPFSESVIDEITHMSIGELLGKKFVELHFSESAKNKVNSMVDNLLIAFQERINALDWMTAETKKEALNKLNAIGRKLGYPSKWEDYSSLVFSADNYIQNIFNMRKFDYSKSLNELYKKVDKDKWGMPAHMVNAYYHPLLNEIAFPAGIMQAPFFDENSEDAVNYGRIGMVIGHEFTHGFDDMGSKFAADGSFKNWWSEVDLKAFEEKTKTYGETFAQFCPIENNCVNPDLTMGENIADLGGLTMAYYAYTRTQEYKTGEKINGFTPAQRFFIAYAQLWKINYTDAELKNRIATDPHSPGMYRVNGPLMNCPEFFDAFGVKEGDKMRNKPNKVSKIW